MNEAEAAPPEEELTRRHKLTIALTSVGVLMVVMDSTIVNVALPIIREDLGYLNVSVAELQWVVNAYALTFAVLLLSAGKLADLFGRKRLFIIGLIIFTGASAACGAANEINVLIGFRAVQGVGAALIMPTTLSIIQTSIPMSRLGVAIGIWSAVIGLGSAIGPLAGGFLAEDIDWPWVFFINIPIGIVVLIGTITSIDESRSDSPDRRIDYIGALLSALGLFLLVFGLLKANEFGIGDTRTFASIACGVAFLGLFVLWERRAPSPMVDLTLFRSRTFSGANILAVIAGFCLFGLLFFGSIFLQSVMGYSAIEAGLAQLPMMAVMVIMGPILGKQIGRIGPGPILTAGMAILCLAFLWLSQLDFDSDFWTVLPGMVLGGLGFSWVLTPLTAAALMGVPFQQAGVGAAIINSTRQIGGAMGLAILGVISAELIDQNLLEGHPSPDGFVDGFQYLMYTSATVALIGSVVAYAMVLKPAREAKAAAAEAAAAEAAAAAAAPAPPAAPQEIPIQQSASWAVSAPSVVGALPTNLARRVAGSGLPSLEVVAGPAAGTKLSLDSGPLLVGRGEEGPGKLGDDQELSRRHATFTPRGREVVVEDLGSTNGTRVNGEEISGPRGVGPDDAVEVGTTTLKVVPAPAAAGVPEMSVVSGPAAGVKIPVANGPLVFGRAELGPGSLGNDPALSRRHASASLLDATRLLVEDLGSTNGTYVNDHRIAAPTVVGPGDTVKLGASTLTVEEGS